MITQEQWDAAVLAARQALENEKPREDATNLAAWYLLQSLERYDGGDRSSDLYEAITRLTDAVRIVQRAAQQRPPNLAGF